MRKNLAKRIGLTTVLRAVVVLACVIGMASPRAWATSGSWTGLGGDGTWTNTSNWTASPPPTSADTATFNGAGNGFTTITIDSGRTLKGITFDTTSATLANYTIGSAGINAGNALTLASTATIQINNNGTTAVTETINAPLIFQGNETFTNAQAGASSSLVINGNITNTATSLLTLSGAGIGTNTLAANISNGTGTQSVTFSHTNGGVWNVTGTNSYSGTTTVSGSGGFTMMSGSNSSGGAVTLSNGTLQLNSNSNGGIATGLLTLTAGTLQAVNAERSISNAATLTAVTVSGSQNLNFTGKITGATGASRTLTSSITGGATLTLADVDINTETANARTLTVAGSGNTTINGTIANGNGTTANNLTISNTGTTTLGGTNSFTGLTTLSGTGATLILSGTNSTGAFTMSAAATVQLNNATNGGMSSGTLTLTTGTIQALTTGRSLSNAVALATVTISGSQNVTFTGKTTGSATGSASVTSSISGGTFTLGDIDISTDTVNVRTFTINGTGNTTVSGNIANGNGTQANNVTVNNTGTTTFSGTNSYTGLTTVNNTTGTLVLSGSGGAGTFTITSGTVQLNSNTNGGIASGTLTLTGGTLQAIGATRSISNTISASSGTGTTISGTQSINFNGKIIGLTGGNRAISSSLTGGALLTINNIDINTDIASSRTFTLGGTGNTTISGTIANGNGTTAGNFTLSNTGTTTLSGTNNYTGATSITGAGAIVNVTGTMGNTAITLNNATATLNLQNAAAVSQNTLTLTSGTINTTVTNALSGTAALAVNGGVANLQAANDYSGGTTVTGAKVSVSSVSALGSGAVTLNANGVLVLPGATDIAALGAVVAGASTGAIALDTSSSTAIDMSTITAPISLGAVGAVTYSGAITPNGTIYRFGGGGGTLTVSSLLGSGKSVAVINSGTVILTNTSNAFSGVAVYNGGTLQVNAGTLPGNGAIAIGAAIGTVGTSNFTSGNLDLSAIDYTASSLQVTSTSGTSTITIGSGKTLSVTGGFTIGAYGASNTTNATFTGGGTLSVSNSSGSTVNFGTTLGNSNASYITVTDLTNLASATFKTGTINLGNLVQSQTSTVHLSGGTNVWDANSLVIGAGKGNGIVDFAGSTGSLKIRGFNVDTDSEVRMGSFLLQGGPGTGTSKTSTMDMTDHAVDFRVGTMTLANQTNNASGATGNSTAVLSFNSGTIDVTSLLMGQKTGSAAPDKAFGTLNQAGGILIVGSAELGRQVGSGTAEGKLNLTGGTATFGGDITDGGGATTSSVILAGGSLNMQGHNIGSLSSAIDNVTLTAGTLSNVAEVNGGSGITKSGTASDVLTIAGTNTYTGLTTVSGGKLLVNGSITSAVSVQSTATLGGGGTTGAVTVASGGTLAPGSSAGALNVGDAAIVGNFSLDLDKAAVRSGQAPVAGTDYDQLNVTGTVDVGGANLVLALGNGLEINDVLYVLKNDGGDAVSNSFTSLNGSPTTLTEGSQFQAGAVLFTITYTANAEGSSFTGGNDIALQVTAVPEPAELSLLAIAAVALLKRRERKA